MKCTVCGHVFEDMFSINSPNPPCPADGRINRHDGEQLYCEGPTVKIPSPVSRPQGGGTPLHYRNMKENG